MEQLFIMATQPSPPPPNSEENLTARLRFIEGNRKLCQRKVDLHESNVKIGRGQDCDIIWASMLVSREHATLEYHAKSWFIRNTSRNGVFVNGKLAAKDELLKLKDNDFIHFHPPEESERGVAKYRFQHVGNSKPGPSKAKTETTNPNQETKAVNLFSANVLSAMEDDLCCAICSEVYIEATTIDCGRNYCKYCISQWTQGNQNCPICRKKVGHLVRNVDIANFIPKMYDLLPEGIKKEREDALKEREEEVKKAQVNNV